MVVKAEILLHAARVPDSLPEGCAARWLALLPSAQRRTVARRLAQGGGLDSLAGLALLAGCAECRRLPWPPRPPLRQEAGGRPRWPDGPEFSISHAAGYAICALAPPGVAIGVDLEPLDAAAPRQLRLVMSAGERRLLESGALGAAELWTAKEAVLKAAGAGLRRVREVEIGEGVGHHAGRRFRLVLQQPGHGLVLAVATDATVAVPEPLFVDVRARLEAGP